MFGSDILDVAIGMIFVFFTVSLVCTAIGNKVSDFLNWRSQNLENGIRTLIMSGDSKMVEQLYASSLVKSIVPDGKKPIWIPDKTLMLAVFDTFVPGAAGLTKIDELRDAIKQMNDSSPLKGKLLALVTAAGDNVDGLYKNFAQWYDSVEAQMTAVYKQKMWLFSMGVGVVVSIVLNVDTIAVGQSLWRDSAVRAQVVSAANQYTVQAVQSVNAQAAQENTQKAIQTLNRLNLPIGWNVTVKPAMSIAPTDFVAATVPIGGLAWLLKLAGWLVTGAAGALGAPFWFDILKKVTNRG